MIDEKLIAYLEKYITEDRKATFKDVLSKRTRHFTVVLENVFQPHNASAVVRSCDIFGIQDVYTCLLYTSPSPRDKRQSRMPSSA